MARTYLLFCSLAVFAFVSCSAIGNRTPKCVPKAPTAYRTPQAAQAAQTFWMAFHSADYASSEVALAQLIAASNNDPADSHLNSLVGLCSFWMVLEHERGGLPASATHGLAVQSLNYVQAAARQDPQDRLLPGFVSSAKYQLGTMECNPQMVAEAAQELQCNTNIYPQFHGFVQGWVMTAMLPPQDPRYDQAVEAYFKTLDSCAGIRVPRSFPRLGEIGFYILAKKSKSETVCYNTEIAPHNVEGTLLGLGDALVKQGKLRQARMVYESIRRVPAYPSWPYKDVLEMRLTNMSWLQNKFVADTGCLNVQEPAMLYQSTIACTGCHATCYR